jgi:hypothetical protein
MDTTPQGSGQLDVNSGAAAILGLMGDAEAPQADQQEPQEEVVEQEQEQEQTEQVEETPRYRVKAAGEEREVTLDELIKSYQLGTDYTQKTQSLAEQRKALEAERQAVEQAKALRDQYAERLQAIQQVLAEQSKGENLEALKESDPIGYAVKVAELQQRREQLAAVQAEQQRIAYQQQSEHQQRLASIVAEEQQKLAQAIPEFADPQKGETVRGEIRAYAKQLGFTDQELAQVYDSRAVLTLWKAAQYDKLLSQKPGVQKKVAEAPKVLKPGTSRPVNTEEMAIRDQRKVLKKTGKARDAAAIFERFL